MEDNNSHDEILSDEMITKLFRGSMQQDDPPSEVDDLSLLFKNSKVEDPEALEDLRDFLQQIQPAKTKKLSSLFAQKPAIRYEENMNSDLMRIYLEDFIK